jgi:hypothetical protein
VAASLLNHSTAAKKKERETNYPCGLQSQKKYVHPCSQHGVQAGKMWYKKVVWVVNPPPPLSRFFIHKCYKNMGGKFYKMTPEELSNMSLKASRTTKKTIKPKSTSYSHEAPNKTIPNRTKTKGGE